MRLSYFPTIFGAICILRQLHSQRLALLPSRATQLSAGMGLARRASQKDGAMAFLDTILIRALRPLVTHGELRITTASGQVVSVGEGSPRVAIRFHDARAQFAFLLDPELRTGELFMDGRLSVEHGTMFDFLDIVLKGMREQKPSVPERFWDRLRFATRRFAQRNGLARSRANVAGHYDLGDALYELFLDEDWQYSCAYFETGTESLDDAQLAKKRHIAAKLLLEPGQSVLDIGCGWGGMALYLARVVGAGQVKGISLSQPQLQRARERAVAIGLSDRTHFDFQDYRQLNGSFDRIVSVGMFEHVGINHYDRFFQRVKELLDEDGVMLLHFIGNSSVPDFTNAWIDRYIFPGGHIPSLSEVMLAIERAGLVVTDIEILRLHYARTLRAWRERFMTRRTEAVALYDERFCRMWEYYLSLSEAAFLHQDIAVFQIQLARHQEAVPLTRDYIDLRKQALVAREREAL